MNSDFNLKTSIKSTNNSQKSPKKSVKFDDATTFSRDDHIALTISEHKYIKDKGYTQYFIRVILYNILNNILMIYFTVVRYELYIQLLYRGVEWHLSKRYSDFNDLHNALVKENLKYKIELPKLPMKRWFESNRWFNRYLNKLQYNIILINNNDNIYFDNNNIIRQAYIVYSHHKNYYISIIIKIM